MAPNAEQIFQAALSLPDEDRHQLIEALIAAEDMGGAPSFDEAWRAIVQRRSAELDAEKVQAAPWQDVRDRVHKKIGLDD
jgi:putative addiction module component (TIGR02574 family)